MFIRHDKLPVRGLVEILENNIIVVVLGCSIVYMCIYICASVRNFDTNEFLKFEPQITLLEKQTRIILDC